VPVTAGARMMVHAWVGDGKLAFCENSVTITQFAVKNDGQFLRLMRVFGDRSAGADPQQRHLLTFIAVQPEFLDAWQKKAPGDVVEIAPNIVRDGAGQGPCLMGRFGALVQRTVKSAVKRRRLGRHLHRGFTIQQCASDRLNRSEPTAAFSRIGQMRRNGERNACAGGARGIGAKQLLWWSDVYHNAKLRSVVAGFKGDTRQTAPWITFAKKSVIDAGPCTPYAEEY